MFPFGDDEGYIEVGLLALYESPPPWLVNGWVLSAGEGGYTVVVIAVGCRKLDAS